MSLRDHVGAVLRRDGLGMGETLVVASHIQQMLQWIIRQGVRFFPKQDTPNEDRKQKIEEVVRWNKLDLYYPGVVTTFLCRGSLLWYLRPTGSSNYEIHWYGGGAHQDNETEYAAYFKPGGRELQEVIIRYQYEDYSNTPGTMGYSTVNRAKWVRLRITEEWIVEERHSAQPSLLPYEAGSWSGNYGGVLDRTVQVNSLGFIPCVVSSNFPMRPGDKGHGEFDWLQVPIESENAMRSAMVDNVFRFASPSLVTTRPASQVMEQLAGDDTGQGRPTWSQQQGYGSPASGMSSRRDDPWVRGNRYGQQGGYGSRRSKVASIIGNVLPEERFGYIFPDPINGDQWRFATEYREGIHECLGGIDPLGMKSGMTFGEVKSLYGKVAATANRKCASLWTYGLCQLLEMVIRIEEDIFLASYQDYLLNYSSSKRKWKNVFNQYGSISENEIMKDFVDVSQGMSPPGVSGLPPYGDRLVQWNWTGPVFEKTSRDKLDDSIVVRNEQELGVGSLEAMSHLYPDKTPRDLKAMLTGVPFRFIQSVSGSIGALLSIQQQMMGVPDPQNPNLPLAARMDLTPLIQDQIDTLAKEISYGREFDERIGESSSSGGALPASGTSGGTSSNANAASNGSGVPDQSAYTTSFRATGLPVPGLQQPTANQPATSQPSAGVVSEWQRPIPSPGGSILSPIVPGSIQPTTGVQSTPVQPSPGTGSPGTNQSVYPTGIPYDIASLPRLSSELYSPSFPSTSGSSARRSRRRK